MRSVNLIETNIKLLKDHSYNFWKNELHQFKSSIAIIAHVVDVSSSAVINVISYGPLGRLDFRRLTIVSQYAMGSNDISSHVEASAT